MLYTRGRITPFSRGFGRTGELRDKQVIAHDLILLRHNLIEIPSSLNIASTESAPYSSGNGTCVYSPTIKKLGVTSGKPEERRGRELKRVGRRYNAFKAHLGKSFRTARSLDPSRVHGVDTKLGVV